MRHDRFRLLSLSVVGLVAVVGLLLAPPAFAQNRILTIEADRFFAESAFGRRIAEEIDQASQALAQENRRIEAELTEEEEALTVKRSTMASEDFRVLADDFDTKVQSIRRTQDIKGRALADRGEQGRVAFLSAARPVLTELMQDAGASLILERNTVFFSSNAGDITDEAIRRIDAEIGDGSESGLLAPGTSDATPETETDPGLSLPSTQSPEQPNEQSPGQTPAPILDPSPDLPTGQP